MIRCVALPRRNNSTFGKGLRPAQAFLFPTSCHEKPPALPLPHSPAESPSDGPRYCLRPRCRSFLPFPLPAARTLALSV